MVDHRAKVYMRIREHQPRLKICDMQVSKLESILARSYSDDTDIRQGALSAPRMHHRPGQRDDEMYCTPASMLTAL